MLPGTESFTLTITVNLPAAVGVPLIVAPLAVTPSGRPVTVQVYGGTPPDATSAAE